jgi:hypothetical protein
MDNKFFTFIKPYLLFIDSGKLYRKPFCWLYIAIGTINLVFPLYVLYNAIDSRIFSANANVVFMFLFIWFVICAAGWISFQIWWDRKDKVLKTTTEGDDFPATPVISHFIQTLGEWFGIWYAIVGFFSTLFSIIFLGEGYGGYIFGELGLPFGYGFFAMIITPVVGFLIVVFSRFIAEQIRALASIASNTKK